MQLGLGEKMDFQLGSEPKISPRGQKLWAQWFLWISQLYTKCLTASLPKRATKEGVGAGRMEGGVSAPTPSTVPENTASRETKQWRWLASLELSGYRSSHSSFIRVLRSLGLTYGHISSFPWWLESLEPVSKTYSVEVDIWNTVLLFCKCSPLLPWPPEGGDTIPPTTSWGLTRWFSLAHGMLAEVPWAEAAHVLVWVGLGAHAIWQNMC